MLSVLIFLIIIIFKADALGLDINDPVGITFEIIKNERNYLTCDHFADKNQQHKYTFLEGEELTITTKYTNLINHLICSDSYRNKAYLYVEKDGLTNVTTVQKSMGTLWNCTVLTHRNNPKVLPVVWYNNDIYSAAYCFLNIHVRQMDSILTIFVNNVLLQAVRTDRSEDFDFTAKYQYADGDVINVTCANFLNSAQLTIEYEMAGTMSDKSIMEELQSYPFMGFVATMHPEHNNSYMICSTLTLATDNIKVMVRFVMRTEFNNIVNVRINGMTVRPKLTSAVNNSYKIDYKYFNTQLIDVVCEVKRTDMTLVVIDRPDFGHNVNSYKKTELMPTKKAEMSFIPVLKTRNKGTDGETLWCLSDNSSGANTEGVAIYFTESFYIGFDKYALHMELLSNGTVMELYGPYKLKVIFYEFYDGETLQLKCGPLPSSITPSKIVFQQLEYSDECKTIDCTVSETLYLTRKDDNTQIACYIKEQNHPDQDEVIREIRVILRERVLTTTTSTTTISPVTVLTTAVSASSETSSNSYTLIYCLTAAGVSVIIILSVLYLAIKKPCCCLRSSSQELPPVPAPTPNPQTVYYENLLSVFKPINEREAAELENHYEEIQ